jgi:hypothetical protein
MNAEQIKEKLDRLAEFYAQKDSIEANKRAMLDEVKIPAEVERVMRDGMQRMQALDSEFPVKAKSIHEEVTAKLAEIEVPEEVKALLAEIDRQRALVYSWQSGKEAEIRESIHARKAAIQAETEAETRAVYDDVYQRKQEIADEFADKEKVAAENIAKLEAEIRADVIARAAKKLEEDLEADDLSVKNGLFHAVYSRGRITWDAKRLDKLPRRLADATVELDSFVAMTEELASLRKRISDIAWVLSEARKEGDPSVALRKL